LPETEAGAKPREPGQYEFLRATGEWRLVPGAEAVLCPHPLDLERRVLAVAFAGAAARALPTLWIASACRACESYWWEQERDSAPGAVWESDPLPVLSVREA